MTDNPHEIINESIRKVMGEMGRNWAEEIDRQILGVSAATDPEQPVMDLDALSGLINSLRPPHSRDTLVMHPDTWYKSGLNEVDLGAMRLITSSYVSRGEMFTFDSRASSMTGYNKTPRLEVRFGEGAWLPFSASTTDRFEIDLDTPLMSATTAYCILLFVLFFLTLLIGLLI